VIPTRLRDDDEATSSDQATAPAPPAPAVPAPLTPAWASAVGNRQVARMAAELAEQAAEEQAAGESEELLEGLGELLAAVDEEPVAEVEEAAEGVARLRRSPLARQPAKTKPAPRKIPLTGDDIADLKRVGTRTIRELAKLEQERAITTAEAQQGKENIEALMERSKKGRGDRKLLAKHLNRMRAIPDWARKRAAAGRSTEGKKLVSDLKLEPPVIRVGEGEAARISFVVKATPRSIGAHILEDPNREGTSYRFFNIDATPGYHQLIWDGTFTGKRNRPPEPGVYRIEISVAGEDGKTEILYEQIRVENPEGVTALPRVGSGLAVSTLTFDGRTLILTDDGGNTIEVPATSGLKPNNKKNPDGVDYTDPKWEWEAGKGPIPRGRYEIKPGQFQLPDADKRGTRYASGGTAAKWGPMRAQILPNVVKNRSEFFLHMDVTNDGTAGCIGIPPGQEGKFNQIMSLIATSQKDIKLFVSY
jgi:hypothetical protein